MVIEYKKDDVTAPTFLVNIEDKHVSRSTLQTGLKLEELGVTVYR